eukprot:CAMPEP_0202500582 /NCGR_PEP_ID=MMETSP1361-20130828/33610_1 /ASSEMBLY_ACC=CAM_ASM_000849 /TAXON_ID=210615 /ORGANISM="Staurosira complex sp., Strain CCMP2646" /LENGTH=601 /DNA_ID=CAMNT_0049133083 /DNA_START=44 /DNA_END=1849 /DNA_ORIENTATION=+
MDLSFANGIAAVVVAAVLVAYWMFPPLPVVLRTARPIVTAIGILSWIGFRLFFSPPSSFLDLFVDQLHRINELLVDVKLLSDLWTVFQDVLGMLLIAATWRFVYCLMHYSLSEWKELLIQTIFEWSQENIPLVKNELNKVKKQTAASVQQIIGKDPNRILTTCLPQDGIDATDILARLSSKGRIENQAWQNGKVSGAVYPAGKEHSQLMHSVYGIYIWANPLHAGIWPTVNQCEGELIAMTANILHGNDETVGATSSGGTESIVLAIKAHREYYGRKRGIAYPEVICGTTAHAAVDKACELLGIRKVSVEVDPVTFALDPRQIEKRITSNTILIYASAPTFMQGVIDPIEELSDVALKYDVGLHVDACLGGFVLPFAQKLGYDIPKFDFECPGVTSMSADAHKFAYACKGISIVLYRNEELRHAQYFSYAKWSGGLYATPTIAGSRPGALVACAWAALVSMGESGYKRNVTAILKASQAISDGISEIPGIRVLGTQVPTMIVCFDSINMDIYRVGSKMSKRGWELNSLQNPPCLHICVTMNTVPHVQDFVNDLKDSVAQVKLEGPAAKKSGSAAIYGMAGALPAGPVDELMKSFIDEMLKV